MIFQFGTTAAGRRLKFLSMIGEYSSLFLAIRDGLRCKAMDVVYVLEALSREYPSPGFIGFENCPEFIAQATQTRFEACATTKISYIALGIQWEHTFAQSINRGFRDEPLNTKLLTTAPEAQILGDRWGWEHNSRRPYSAPERIPLAAAQQGATAPPEQSTLIKTGQEWKGTPLCT